MAGTSNFIGEQADKSCDIMDFDNPEEHLPFEEVREKRRRRRDFARVKNLFAFPL